MGAHPQTESGSIGLSTGSIISRQRDLDYISNLFGKMKTSVFLVSQVVVANR